MPFVPLSRNWLAHQLARTPIQRSGGQLLADVTPPYFAVVTHEGRPNCPHYSRSQYAPRTRRWRRAVPEETRAQTEPQGVEIRYAEIQDLQLRRKRVDRLGPRQATRLLAR